MNRILLFLIFFFLLSQVHGQKRLKVEITYEQINSNEYQVFAISKEKETHSVRLDYLALKGLKANVELPFYSNVEPGKTPMFKLFLTGTTDKPGYTPLIQFSEGPLKTKFQDFEYSLPISENKEVLIYSTIDTAGLAPDQDYREYIYSLAIDVNAKDTLFAARSGKVLAITENLSSNPSEVKEAEESPLFTLQVEHNDGSVGYYLNYTPIKKMAKKGRNVLAGDPIGLGPQEGYSLFYVKDDVYDSKRNSRGQNFLFIKFKVDEHDPILILDSAVYKGYLTDEMIMQEMSKRQKKRYLKSISSK